MNKKPSNKAMNNKIFLGLWFILFAALILLVNWLFRIPVLKTDNLMDRLADTDKQITKLTAIHAKFLLNKDKEDISFSSAEFNVELEARLVTEAIKRNLNNLVGLRHLSKNNDINSSLNEVSMTLNESSDNLHNLFLIIRERGDHNSGLIARWLALSKSMAQ